MHLRSRKAYAEPRLLLVKLECEIRSSLVVSSLNKFHQESSGVFADFSNDILLYKITKHPNNVEKCRFIRHNTDKHAAASILYRNIIFSSPHV